jgi:hypothetical protein
MSSDRRLAVLAAILSGDGSLATCDCGGEATATVESVRGRGPIVVYVCSECGVAWAQTRDPRAPER